MSLGLHSLHLVSSLGWVLLGHRPFLLQFDPCFLLLLVCGLTNTSAMPLYCFHHTLLRCACWAYHVFFLYLVRVAQYFCWVSFHIILGFLGPFYFSGHPWPTSFLWASLAHSIFTFTWAFC